MDSSSGYIANIYNYCDTWCERCLFTARCRSFQIQSEAGLAKPMTAGENLVQQLTEALTLTKQYIETLTGPGEPAAPDAQAAFLEEKAVQRVDTRRHPVAQLANDYLRQSGNWLTDHKHLLEQAGRQQIQVVELGLSTQEEVMPLLHALKDAWEMIRWYRTLIPVKAQSALRILNEPSSDQHLHTYHLGKAKLVLVSIDRSLSAWQTILDYYPEKTDDLLDLLALLSRMSRVVETTFPDARAFKRPGLD